MEKIKFNPDLESEGGKLYRQYCEEKGIDYSITAGANFCLGYMAVKPQPRPVWVKTADRLPGWNQPVHWRIGNGPQTKGKTPLSEFVKGGHIENWQWLDESATPAAPEGIAKILASYEKFFKECWPRLIDRPVSDEREINSAWEVHKRREGLMEAVAGREKSDAIRFNIFCTDDYYYENGHWWHKSNHDPYSVDQLYQLFKQPAEGSGEKEGTNE